MGDEANQTSVKLCLGSSASPISSIKEQYFSTSRTYSEIRKGQNS